VLKSGGFKNGGTNFDAKLRRQSLDAEDLISSHVGAMDVCAAGLKAAAKMLADGKLEALRNNRYSGWDTQIAKEILNSDLETIYTKVLNENINPEPKSGRQEFLENLVNRYI
jgi:xylose isomerase